MVFIDPAFPQLVSALLIIVLMGTIMRYLKQPHAIAYIILGVLLGPHAIGWITNEQLISRLGGIGVVLLLFFTGMEASLPRLISNWKIAFIGTFSQILLSLGIVAALGYWFEWPFGRILLLGFVISLSSTAVVLKILENVGEMNTRIGQNVLGILLCQDLAIVPMLIIVSFVGGTHLSTFEIFLQFTGGILIFLFMGWIIRKKEIRLPLGEGIRKDHEMQLFVALVICFGVSLITGFVGLSTALGAFLAGIIVSVARETQWVHKSLDPFRIIFTAVFFVSIGIMIDLNFLITNLVPIMILVLAVFLTNCIINATILRFLGESLEESIYSGAMLSQIGEFSFVLAAIGLQSQLINDFSYQMTIVVIALSLLFSPPWISLMRRIAKD